MISIWRQLWPTKPSRQALPDETPVPVSGIFRILVCRVTHSLGNTLLITPLVRELQDTYPGAEIDIVARNTAAVDIFGAFAGVRTIYCLPAHAFRHPGRYIATLRRLRRVPYDMVVDPCPRSRTGRSLLRLARGRIKVGFAHDRRAATATHEVAVPSAPRHVGQLPVFLLRSLLGKPESDTWPFLDIALSADERRQGARALGQLIGPAGAKTRRGVIGIFANATGYKLLPAPWWHEFLDTLEERYGDYTFVEIVPMTGQSLLGSRYPAVYRSSIRGLAGVLSALSVFVSADCGVMHLASASGVPTIGIFSITDPQDWGPYGPHDRAVDARGLTPAQTAGKVCL